MKTRTELCEIAIKAIAQVRHHPFASDTYARGWCGEIAQAAVDGDEKAVMDCLKEFTTNEEGATLADGIH